MACNSNTGAHPIIIVGLFFASDCLAYSSYYFERVFAFPSFELGLSPNYDYIIDASLISIEISRS